MCSYVFVFMFAFVFVFVLEVWGSTWQPDSAHQPRRTARPGAGEDPPPAPFAVRSFCVCKSDILMDGYTPHCTGWVAIRLEKAPQRHSGECRAAVLVCSVQPISQPRLRPEAFGLAATW